MNYKDIALLPIIVGIVSIIKGLGLSKKYAPLVSLGIGVVFGIVFVSDGDIKKGILEGAVTGLAASGLYSNGKEIMKKTK